MLNAREESGNMEDEFSNVHFVWFVFCSVTIFGVSTEHFL